MTEYKFENNASTTLAAAMGSGDSSFTSATGGGALFPEIAASDGYKFYVIVEEGSKSESMLVDVRSGETFSGITRGGSESFAAGATVKLVVNATILASFVQKGVYRSNDGSPDGALAASYTGEEVLDSTNNEWYKHCTGTTWKKMNPD